jgi:multidrug efflux pump subunit AcrB
MRKGMAWAIALLALPTYAVAQQSPQPAQAAPSRTAPAARITLDEAIRLALQHNHALQAARSTILQSQALETTANLRPNPVLSWDAQFLPIFEPSKFTADYIDNSAQFDLGLSYTFEIGKKRQHRLQAARDQTTVTRSQVADNERGLIFNVAQQFISALLAQSNIDFAVQDLDSFQKTVEISQARYNAGGMSEGDLLKIKLQLLQFQTDVSAAKLAKVQAIAGLRQLVGFESVPDAFDVEGQLDYQSVHASLDDSRYIGIQFSVTGRDLEGIVHAGQEAIGKAVQLPEGYRLEWGGEYSELLESRAQFYVIGPLAVLLIFLILFALYGNFKFPVSIALGVVMTEPVGALIALKLTHTPFSVASLLGLLALLGVSVETAVILVSYINKLRLEGKSIRDATYEASLLRLRPIMMTALVACLGLLPAALSTGVGSDTQKPFAIVIVAGLLSRLFLGFFVNPVLYEVVAREGDVLQA